MTANPRPLRALSAALTARADFWDHVRIIAWHDNGYELRLERYSGVEVRVRVNDEGFVVKIGNGPHKWCRFAIPDAVAMVMPPGA